MVLNVSEEQMKEAMNTFIERTCDFCSTELNSFSDARNHYIKIHNSLNHNSFNCCNAQLRTKNEFLDHIYWHFNPNVFVYVYLCRFVHISELFFSKGIFIPGANYAKKT